MCRGCHFLVFLAVAFLLADFVWFHWFLAETEARASSTFGPSLPGAPLKVAGCNMNSGILWCGSTVHI